MYTRGLTNRIINMFDVGYDDESKAITFPIKELDGKVYNIVKRSINTKFFTMPKDMNKTVYGAWYILDGGYKEVWVTESILNCLTCWKYGIPAIALLGTGTKEQYAILNSIGVRTYILALDADEAGIKGTKKLRKNLNTLVKEVVYTDVTKDINDLQGDILNLKKVF